MPSFPNWFFDCIRAHHQHDIGQVHGSAVVVMTCLTCKRAEAIDTGDPEIASWASSGYLAAWDRLAAGLGDLARYLPEARAFVGDRALLDLMNEYDPVELIIAINIEIVAEVLEFPTDPAPEDGPVLLAVIDAHRALVAQEGDQRWRRYLPPDAAAIMREELHRLSAGDERAQRRIAELAALGRKP